LADIMPQSGFSEADLLRVAFNLERQSEHPFSEALRKKSEELNIGALRVDEFQAVVGKGIRGAIDGKTYFAGNMALYEDSGKNLDESVRRLYQEKELSGASPVLVWGEDGLMGIL